MPVTKTQNWQIVQQAALPVIGKPSRTSNEDINAALDKHLDSPLRLYAAATPDSKLYFSASATETGDGSVKTIPPIDEKIVASVAGSLDYQEIGAYPAMVSGISLYKEGTTYSHPVATATNKFILGVFVRRADGYYDCKYSPEQTSLANAKALEVGDYLAALEGLRAGYVYLESIDTSGRWKSATAVTNVIQNKVGAETLIYRFGAGDGGGGGAIKDFKIQSISDPTAVIKGGYIKIDDGRELATYDGALYGKDLSLNLDTIFGGDPVANTAYYLYLDLETLSSSVITNGRTVYAITQVNFKISTITPESRDPRRYIYIGSIKSATAATTWSGTGAAFATAAIRHHETLAKFFSYPETYVDESITTAVALNTLSHNLSGEPHSLYLTYDDGATEIGLDLSAHLLDVTATQIKISSLGLTFGGGQKLRVRAVRFPQQLALASASRTFTSAWYDSTAVTTLPHGLNDSEDIRGYEVQEWNVSTNRIKNIDRSALVVNFDGTNFYLNWTGLTPSGTLKYRVVAGGSPIPHAIPIEYGGYTKFVGMGPGSYATLTVALAASAPGDSIYVARDTVEPAGDLILTLADVDVDCKPGVKIGLSGAMDYGFRITGSRSKFKGRVSLVPTQNMSSLAALEGNDCSFIGKLELDAAYTVTAAVRVDAIRTYAQVGVSKTAGTITALDVINASGGKTDVWGG